MADPEISDSQPPGDFVKSADPEATPDLPSTTLAVHAAPVATADKNSTSPPRGLTREILHLSWPVMLAQGAITFAGIIDRAMVGRLGDYLGGAATPLAAVGLASQFFFLVQSSLFAVGFACVALMARAIGARRPEEARSAMAASIQVAVVISLGLSIPIGLSGARALAFLGAEPAVVEAAVPYLNYVLGSSVLLAFSMVIESGMRSDKNMRIPMLIAGATTVAKLILNWLLIFGNWGFPRMELVGAGLATLISQALALALLLEQVRRTPSTSPIALHWRELLLVNPRTLEVVRIAVPGIAERLVMNGAMLTYIWILGHSYGTLAVAAYTVGIPLLAFSWIPGTSYAQATSTLVGQSLGAEEPEYARRIGWRGIQLAVGTAIVLGFAVGIFRYEMAELLTNDTNVIRELGPFMLILAIAQPVLQLQFALGGVHRGAGDTVNPLIAAALGNWLFRLPMAFGFALWLESDILWVWSALIFDHTARSAYLLFTFSTGRWKSKLSN